MNLLLVFVLIMILVLLNSYVVLFTKAVIKQNKTVLTHDVHFWLGGTTSQDEAGTAVRVETFFFSSSFF